MVPTQVIGFERSPFGSNTVVNGFQLRDITVAAVPEPATLAVFGVMALGAFGCGG